MTNTAKLGAGGQSYIPAVQQPLSMVTWSDSILAGGWQALAVAGSTFDGTKAVLNVVSHNMAAGSVFYLGGPNDPAGWGEFTVTRRVSADFFEFIPPQGFPYRLLSTTAITCMPDQTINDRNLGQVASAQMYAPFTRQINRGAPGQTSTQLIKLYKSQVLDLASNFILGCVGTNDMLQAVAGQEAAVLLLMQTNKLQAIGQAIGQGTVYIACTIPPLSSSASGFTAARQRLGMRFNEWLRLTVRGMRGVILLDLFNIMVNSTTGDYRPNWSADGIHPNATAIRAAADEFKRLISGVVPPGVGLMGTLVDSAVTDPLSQQLLRNGVMNGTAGTIAGGVTGSAADNWTLTQSGGAVVGTGGQARNDIATGVGYGFDQGMAVTFAGIGNSVDLLSTDVAPTVGQYIWAECNVTGTAITNLSLLQVWIDAIIDGNTYSIDAIRANGATNSIDAAFNYYLKTPFWKVPAGTLTNCRLRVKLVAAGAGGGTFTVGRGSLLQTPTLPYGLPNG